MSEIVEGTVQTRICDFLPEGYMALGFVLSVKALDDEGSPQLCHVRSADIPDWEVEGVLRSHIRYLLDGVYLDEDDDEE